ncbi:MAG: hypothetical protein JO250_20500 [Armatimonadetes bacterium]|nr:hypothetical protein [Armatimonadota bacterium]
MHDATGADHGPRDVLSGALHRAMEAAGFSRLIRGGEGTRYPLPTAEYDRLGSLTREPVLDAARRVPGRPTGGRRPVTESNGSSSFGLDVADEATAVPDRRPCRRSDRMGSSALRLRRRGPGARAPVPALPGPAGAGRRRGRRTGC